MPNDSEENALVKLILLSGLILFSTFSVFADQQPGDNCVFVVLGDSISSEQSEWGGISAGRFTNSTWHLKASGGYKTTDILAELDTRLIPYLDTNKTNRAFLLVGINDIFAGRTVEDTVSSYTNLAHAIITNGFDLTCLTMYSWPSPSLTEKIQDLNDGIQGHASEFGYAIVDIWAPLLDYDTGLLKAIYNLGDGHITKGPSSGSEVIADYVGAHIQSGFEDTEAAVITVGSGHGTTAPSTGTHAYIMGSMVSFSADSVANDNGTNWTCIGWTGTGSPPSNGNENITAHILLTNLTSSITWNWQLSADLDLDGLPDTWEYQYFGHATGAIASVDNDGDRYSNRDEYEFGTVPTNGASHFQLSVIPPSVSNLYSTVRFSTVTGRGYALQYRDSLLEDSWQTMTNTPGTGNWANIMDPNLTPRRYYRITVEIQN